MILLLLYNMMSSLELEGARRVASVVEERRGGLCGTTL